MEKKTTLITKENIKEALKEYRKHGCYIRQDFEETNGGDHGLFITIYDAPHKIKRTLTNDQKRILLDSYSENIDKKIKVFDWIFYSVMLWILYDVVEAGEVNKSV
jgi:hypothetical protein